MKGDVWSMKRFVFKSIYIIICLALLCGIAAPAGGKPLRVVTTLSDYAVLARAIGGDRVDVTAIVQGNQDAHFIRPKPSFVGLLRRADVVISTGLDLEMWLPTVIDKSGNTRLRSGRKGYVAAAHGMNMLEKPTVMSRIEGGVHVYGNPHVTCSPLNMKVAARNIATGLVKNDPAGEPAYQANLGSLLAEFDRRLFGDDLVNIIGGDTLCTLAEKGTVITFLKEQTYQGKPLMDYLGGWMKAMLPLRGKKIVTYHKNWIYFVRLFGLDEAGTIEPKPGIPPSPRHVSELVELMKAHGIRLVLAANYFDEQKVKSVAARVGAEPVIVPLYVGGSEGVDDYFQLVDHWTERLLGAAVKAGIIKNSNIIRNTGVIETR